MRRFQTALIDVRRAVALLVVAAFWIQVVFAVPLMLRMESGQGSAAVICSAASGGAHDQPGGVPASAHGHAQCLICHAGPGSPAIFADHPAPAVRLAWLVKYAGRTAPTPRVRLALGYSPRAPPPFV